MTPSLLPTLIDKKAGRPAGVASTSNQTAQQVHQPSPTRYDCSRPRVLSQDAEDNEFTILHRRSASLDVEHAISPTEFSPEIDPYGCQKSINRQILSISPLSGSDTCVLPVFQASEGMTWQESSYFGDFSYDEVGTTQGDTNTTMSNPENTSSDGRTITPGSLANMKHPVHSAEPSPKKLNPDATDYESTEHLSDHRRSTVSSTLSSSDCSQRTEYSRVSTFGRWFSKGTPDLRVLKFAKERRDSLKKRQEAELPPPEPSPRITSFYNEHEYGRLQREREREREKLELADPVLKQSVDELSRRPSLLKRDASLQDLAIAHSARPAIVRAITRSCRSSNQSVSEPPPPNSTSTLEQPPLVDQRSATPTVEHSSSFWQPRRRFSDEFSHSMMESAQLARSRRTFRDPSSDNSEKSSKYHSSPQRFSSPRNLQRPASPSSSSWFRPRRPRMGRFHSNEYSHWDTSEKAMSRPELKSYQSYPATQNPVKSPTKRPTFLPSEARRINTPPTITTSHDGGNKVSGYFWNFWYSDEDSRNSQNSRTDPSLDQMKYHQPFPQPKEDFVTDSTAQPGPDREKDWYRVRLDRIMDEEEPRDLGELKTFDWDIPEHLPSSPLCPLNPKYRGRGKKVCVYHGRRDNLHTLANVGMEAWR